MRLVNQFNSFICKEIYGVDVLELLEYYEYDIDYGFGDDVGFEYVDLSVYFKFKVLNEVVFFLQMGVSVDDDFLLLNSFGVDSDLFCLKMRICGRKLMEMDE